MTIAPGFVSRIPGAAGHIGPPGHVARDPDAVAGEAGWPAGRRAVTPASAMGLLGWHQRPTRLLPLTTQLLKRRQVVPDPSGSRDSHDQAGSTHGTHGSDRGM